MDTGPGWAFDKERGQALLTRLRGKIWAFEDRLTVREQIAIATAGLCLVVSFVIAFAAAYVGRIEATRLISREMIQISETTSDRIDRYFQGVYHRVQSYTTFNNLRTLGHAEPEKLRPLFDQLHSSFADYTWLAFISKEGVVVAASGGRRERELVAEEGWFVSALQGPVVQDYLEFASLDPAERVNSKQPVRFVKFAFPVRAKDTNEVTGVLVANVHWREPEEIRSNMMRGSDEIVVVARDGEVLLGPKSLRAKYPSKQIAELRRGTHGVFVEDTAAGEMLSGFAAMDGHRDFPGLGWAVISRRPAAVAFAPVSQMFWTIVGIGTIVAMFGVAFAGVIANRVSRPIRALTEAADRIGRDNGTTMMPRQRGSQEVIHLSTALRSLLLRLGFVEQLTQKAAEDARRFEDDIASLRKLAETDPLTNLMNRRAFMESAIDAMRYFQRYGRPIAMLVVDIDHFKRVNDGHGHAAGDAVIRRIGQLIAQTIRETDKVARFGGEEFVVLLREVDEHAAHELAERIRLIVEEGATHFDSKDIPVTISVGCAAITAHDRDIEELIERADRALYGAKAAGRNCVRLAPAPANRQTRAA